MNTIIKVLLLATGISATVLVNRDASAIQSGLEDIDADLVHLKSLVQSYTGGSEQQDSIGRQTEFTDDDVRGTASNVDFSNSLSSPQATGILNYIHQTLTPDTAAALNALVSKKAAFGSFSSTVRSQLSELRTDSNTLSNALISKVPSGSKASASQASSSINALYASAVAAYN